MLKFLGALIVLLLLTRQPSHSVADAPVAPTIGFFLDNWAPKQFTPPATREAEPSAATVTGATNAGAATPAAATPAGGTAAPAGAPTLTIDADSVITRIPPTEFGHNANVWMGPMIPQFLFMAHLRNLHPHVIRWPAGSGSDGYFWNGAPGALPADVPKQLIDKDGKTFTPNWFYGRPKDYTASLDNYYAMLKQTDNEGLITINYGYARYSTAPDPVAAAAHLAADWVRYDHGRTRYWEVGNENSGTWEMGYRIDTANNKDGQPRILTGALYGKHFGVIVDSMRRAAAETGAVIYIGAVTVEAPPHPWDMPLTTNWNAGMMKAIHDKADFYVVHNYFTPYKKNCNAAEILDSAAMIPGRQMSYVLRTLRENGAAIKPIAMDEWNMSAIGGRQMVSNISGLFSIVVLGEALRNKYGLSARWDLLNAWDGGNDHGLFSAGDEPGIARWSPRPSFYYLYYLQRTMGDRLVKATLSGDTALHAYASTWASGETAAVIVNTSANATTLTISTKNIHPHSATPAAAHSTSSGTRLYWYSLSGDGDDEFARKVLVNGKTTTAAAGGPPDYATLPAWTTTVPNTAKSVNITIPARGAVFVILSAGTSSQP